MLSVDGIKDWFEERRRDLISRAGLVYERLKGKPDGVPGLGRSLPFLSDKSRLTPEEANNIPLRDARMVQGICVYAIGDIHGRADLLKKLVESIREDVQLREDSSIRNVIVFLGDYIDRGFQSRQVIEMLLDGTLADFELHFIKGNHEEAFLDFLTDASVGISWSQFGGMETLVSYNVAPPRDRNDVVEWERVRSQLTDVMPDNHREFLQNLEVQKTMGDYIFVHAGLKPGLSLDEQTDRDLMWIRDEFLYHKDPFEKVVVHGHTPITEPHHDFRRISVDTGAYMTGRLTAVKLFEDMVEFIST